MKRMRNTLMLLLCAARLAGCGARSAPAKALEGCRALLGVREGFLEDRAAELAGSSIGDWLAMALLACGGLNKEDLDNVPFVGRRLLAVGQRFGLFK